MAGPAEPPGAQADRLLVAAALACATLVFLPMLGHSFFRDDFQWVERAIDARPHPARWFTIAGTDFRPLASLSFVLNLMTSGLSPAGYYLFNLLLHLSNVALLMMLAFRLSGGSRRATGIAGLLFGVGFAHYGEAVYWICGRTGPIADFFMLATLIAHWDSRAQGRRKERALALLFFGLALLAKETAAILLPLLAALEWAHPARRGRLPAAVADTARRLAPYALMLVPYLAFQFLGWRAGSPILSQEWVVGPHAVTNLLEYAARMFLPLSPSSMLVRLPRPLLPVLEGLQIALMAALPLAWIALLFAPLPRAMKFALLWIPLTILPVVFFTYRTSTRYLYTPAMGVAMFAGMALDAWMTPPRRERRALRRRAMTAWAALLLVVVIQAAVMGMILRRHRELERAEGAERWPRLEARARAAGIDPAMAKP